MPSPGLYGLINRSIFLEATDPAPSRWVVGSGQPISQTGWGPGPSHCWPSGQPWCPWHRWYFHWQLPGSSPRHPSRPPPQHLWLLPPTGTSYQQCLTPPMEKIVRFSDTLMHIRIWACVWNDTAIWANQYEKNKVESSVEWCICTFNTWLCTLSHKQPRWYEWHLEVDRLIGWPINRTVFLT